MDDNQAVSTMFIGCGPRGPVTGFAQPDDIDRWLRFGFLHQHEGDPVPTHRLVCQTCAEKWWD
jgi:hypothetical protein